MNIKNKNILKTMTLFGSVEGLNMLLGLLRAKLAAMLLGPAGIGLNAIYNEAREFIHTTTNLGMDQSGTREIAKAQEHQDKDVAVILTRSWILLFAVMGTLFTLVFALPLSWMLFSDSEHVWYIMLLSPAVGFSTLTCGEHTVLRGLQRLRALAFVSVLSVVIGIVTTVPCYYFWGMEGIVPGIVLSTLCIMLITMAVSYHYSKPVFTLSREQLKKGRQMISIGLSFMLAGLVAHATMLFIQSVLNRIGGLESVGFYNAAYAICFTYTSVIFASLSQEYFPRLSAVFSNKAERDDNVKRQIQITFALSLPITALMYLAMPWLIPLLLSDEFMPIVTIAQSAVLTLPFRAIYLPLAYLPLAAGDSKLYFCMETLSYVIMVCGVLLGYHLFGMPGLGYGLAVVNVMDMICAAICARIKYKL